VTDARLLERECRVFACYLTGRMPEDYVRRKYLEAFSSKRQEQLAVCGRFDRVLLSLACAHPLLTRVTDIYSRFFCFDSAVRRRLVMLLALIETDTASIDRLDYPNCSGMAGLVLGMGMRGVVSALCLVPALVTLLPLQLLLGRCNRRRQEA
jgi:hypothetical protein